MEATVFPKLTLEGLSHQFCHVLLVPQNNRVQCGRRLPEAVRAGGGGGVSIAEAGYPRRVVLKSSWGSEPFENVDSG